MARSPMHPDKHREIALTGLARRHAMEDTSDPEAIAELRLLAQGRADLLAEAAGMAIGGYLAAPGMNDPRTLRAGWLLVAAGADPTLVTGHVDATRRRVGRGGHDTPD